MVGWCSMGTFNDLTNYGENLGNYRALPSWTYLQCYFGRSNAKFRSTLQPLSAHGTRYHVFFDLFPHWKSKKIDLMFAATWEVCYIHSSLARARASLKTRDIIYSVQVGLFPKKIDKVYCTLKCTAYIRYDMIWSFPHPIQMDTNGSFGVCWSVVPCRPQCWADPYHIDDSFPIDPQFGLGWFWTGIILTHIPNHILATFSHIIYLYIYICLFTYSYSHIMLTYIGLFLVCQYHILDMYIYIYSKNNQIFGVDIYWYAMFCLGFKNTEVLLSLRPFHLLCGRRDPGKGSLDWGPVGGGIV